ncbi:hypothetical protein PR202_ga30100 [Eleusine coracana subsp. coracana]|uniref:Ribosomal protein L27 n=1 Tax=Eleusine coracana subsp. coracana TaxID=191504 RepID=A0AAV5DMV2_ELECO|nr:hypothetical protein PR202_ga30100 [Eleusine coracana subsp. coracana]
MLSGLPPPVDPAAARPDPALRKKRGRIRPSMLAGGARPNHRRAWPMRCRYASSPPCLPRNVVRSPLGHVPPRHVLDTAVVGPRTEWEAAARGGSRMRYGSHEQDGVGGRATQAGRSGRPVACERARKRGRDGGGTRARENGGGASAWEEVTCTRKMALSSVFRRVNVKELISNASVYISSTESSGAMGLVFRRWATKKTAGSTKNGRDSNPKYLGVKKFGGEKVEPGNIIVRQRGTRFHPGNYVGMGKDHTLFCLKEGHVRFERNKLTGRKWVHVEPVAGHALHPIYVSSSTTAADKAQL